MIPVNKPSITLKDTLEIKSSIESTFISGTSPSVNNLKKSFSKQYNLNHCAVASSGSAAIEAALNALGVSLGDEVIVPSFTIITCATAVIRLNGTPVIVDVENETFGLNFDNVLKAISKKTKCIMLCHLFGMAARDTLLIKEFCNKNKIYLLEDISQSYGARIKGKLVGHFGDICAGSLYSNKIITAGEGGIILSNDKDLIKKADSYCNLFFGEKDRFVHEKIGFNYRMSGLAAALANSQIKRLKTIIKQRNSIKFEYLNIFSKSKKYNVWNGLFRSETVLWMFPLKINLNKSIDDLEKFCLNNDIQIRKMYLGLNRQPCLKNKVRLFGTFEVSDELYKKHFYIPTFIGIKKSQMLKVFKTLERF